MFEGLRGAEIIRNVKNATVIISIIEVQRFTQDTVMSRGRRSNKSPQKVEVKKQTKKQTNRNNNGIVRQ